MGDSRKSVRAPDGGSAETYRSAREFLAISLVATYLPARRATQIEPIVALPLSSVFRLLERAMKIWLSKLALPGPEQISQIKMIMYRVYLGRKLIRYIRAYSKTARPFHWKYSDLHRRVNPC